MEIWLWPSGSRPSPAGRRWLLNVGLSIEQSSSQRSKLRSFDDEAVKALCCLRVHVTKHCNAVDRINDVRGVEAPLAPGLSRTGRRAREGGMRSTRKQRIRERRRKDMENKKTRRGVICGGFRRTSRIYKKNPMTQNNNKLCSHESVIDETTMLKRYWNVFLDPPRPGEALWGLRRTRRSRDSSFGTAPFQANIQGGPFCLPSFTCSCVSSSIHHFIWGGPFCLPPRRR